MNPKKNENIWNEEIILKQSYEILNAFMSIKKTIRHKFEKNAKKYGFTSPQLSVIFNLYKMPSITLNELSEHMMLSKSTVSGIVDRLCKQGVVKREIPQDNRRIVKLTINEAFIKENDITKLKENFIFDIISNAIVRTNKEEIDEMIYAMNKLSTLLCNED